MEREQPQNWAGAASRLVIVVPCHNEENMLCETARTLLVPRRAARWMSCGVVPKPTSFLRGIVPMLEVPTTTVRYARRARMTDTFKYAPRRMLSLACGGVTSFSVACRPFAWGIREYVGKIYLESKHQPKHALQGRLGPE